MDPISIIGSATAVSKAAFALSTTLYTFVEATRNGAQSVQSLYDEVAALARTLDAMSGSLNRLPTATLEEGNANYELWKSVKSSLTECLNTVEQFHSALSGLHNSGSNLASQTLRAFKLNFKEPRLNILRTQVQTHNTALQLGLQMINVHICSAAPNLVIDELGSKIELLVEMITQLNHSLWTATRLRDDATSIVPASLGSLVVSAEKVVTEASSIMCQSRSVSLISRESIATAKSEIEEWITHPECNNSALTAAENRKPSLSQSNEDSDSALSYDNIQCDDEDEEFELEVVEVALKNARLESEQTNYAKSESFLQQAYINAYKLCPRRQQKLDLKKMQLEIGICCLNQGKLNDVEYALVEIERLSRDEKNREGDILVMLGIMHLQAEIFLAKKQLGEAYCSCREALAGRRKALGKEHPDYHASLALLSVISEASGEFVKATIYRDMISNEVENQQVRVRRERRISKFIQPQSR